MKAEVSPLIGGLRLFCCAGGLEYADRGHIRTGQIEGEITEAVIRFEKEFMGRGPVEAKTYIVDDMVLVRLKGVMSRAEHQLATEGDAPRGRDLVKQVRRESLERGACCWRPLCGML